MRMKINPFEAHTISGLKRVHPFVAAKIRKKSRFIAKQDSFLGLFIGFEPLSDETVADIAYH